MTTTDNTPGVTLTDGSQIDPDEYEVLLELAVAFQERFLEIVPRRDFHETLWEESGEERAPSTPPDTFFERNREGFTTHVHGFLLRDGHVVELHHGYMEKGTRLPPSLARLARLESLVVANPDTLPPGIRHLPNLRHVIGEWMDGPRVPPVLLDCPGLEMLHISGHHLREIPPDIDRLPNLRSLEMANSPHIRRVPDSITHLEHLEALHLQANRLESLPDDIGNLRRLRHLGLNYNRLASLPPPLTELRDLDFIILYENNLSALPDDLGRLTKLQYLLVEQNHLAELPASICRLPALEEIRAVQNDLAGLPDDLGRASSLRWLALEGNDIATLPDLGRLRALESLNVMSNELTRFPASILELPKLDEVNLAYNHITDVPAEVAAMPALKKLFLKGNPLSQGTRDMLARLEDGTRIISY